ncbi:MAG: anion permease [Bacteroidales bacterium]|nr:anion permease [Bacteroidales bacterium]MCF8455598.1 anion permease [Bacteroidales bacterium]
MLNLDVIVVFVVILFILVSLYKELLGMAFTFLIAIVVLGVAGILTPLEMMHGFANEQIAVIMLLLLLGDIIRKTRAVEFIFDKIFRHAHTYKSFLGRMVLLIAGFSAFLNNTPLVAVMMPYVHSWSKRHNVSPSKLLIPLSYAAILGGCATLIGTSTNLIVNGLLADQEVIPGLATFNMFDFIYVGLPMIVIGFFFLLFFADKLLPSNPDVLSDFSTNTREYMVEALVEPNSSLIGKSVEEAGLRNLKGLFLVEIIRDDKELRAVSPDEYIRENDRLLFAGETETVADMVNSNMGLVLPDLDKHAGQRNKEILEIVVSHNSQLINQTAKLADFRSNYDASIIAIHRNGERVSGKIGQVRIKAGDVLLLMAGSDFETHSAETQDFYLISKIKDIHEFEWYKIPVLLGGTFLAIALSAFHVVSLFKALLVLLLILGALKIATLKDIKKGFDYNLFVIIALSLALGKAMINTGVADLVSDLLTKVFLPLGNVGLLLGIYLITSLLAAYITNKAAAAIVFPVSLTMALNQGLNPMPFILIVAFAAAANFMTPHGYQTNLMVYGPGAYTFRDFFRIGFPLTVLYLIVTVTILSLMYF